MQFYLINCQNLPFFGYIHCVFCLSLHITHGDMKENVNGCFFSEHSVHYINEVAKIAKKMEKDGEALDAFFLRHSVV